MYVPITELLKMLIYAQDGITSFTLNIIQDLYVNNKYYTQPERLLVISSIFSILEEIFIHHIEHTLSLRIIVNIPKNKYVNNILLFIC